MFRNKKPTPSHSDPRDRPPPEPESPTLFKTGPHVHAELDTETTSTYPHQPFQDIPAETHQQHPIDTAEDDLAHASDPLLGSTGPSRGPLFSVIPSSSSVTTSLFSTPSSGARLSSYFNGPATHHHRDTLPTLRDDLDKYTGQISTEDFVPRVLGVSLETIEKWSRDLEPLMGYSEVVDALDRYFAADAEPDHYQPFADLLNVIKAAAPHLIESSVDFPVGKLCFVRNDPTCIKGDTVKAQWAHRKPDVVGLREDDLVDDPQDYITDDIHWADILLALEFKLENAANTLRESWKKTRAKWESVNWAVKRKAPIPLGYLQGKTMKNRRGLTAAKDKTPPTPSKGASKREGDELRASRASKRAKSTQGSIPRGLASVDPMTPMSGDKSLATPASKPFETSSAAAVGSVKPNPEEQTASYGLEMLGSMQGTRQHALSILVQDDFIQLWYFDACGILRTPKEISILDNFSTFAAVIVAFCSLTPQQWGETQVVKDYERALGPDAPAVEEFPRRSLTGGLITFPDHRVYKLKECLASQYTLVGRRTTVYSAMFHHREHGEDPDDKELASKEVVVKLSYQVCKRTPEWDFIDAASKAGIDCIPTIFSRGDFEKLSDGVPRKGLSPQQQGRMHEDRVLRGLVSPRYQKVTDILQPHLYTGLLGHVVICLQRLRDINILHRDISVGNILCEQRPSGKFHAIVNDFDLATWIKADGSPELSLSNHRTGTLPFMALELLRKRTIQHRLRHDLESLFYVAIWWAVEKDSTDNHAARNALARWNEGPENRVAGVKEDFLEDSFIKSKVTFSGPYFVFGKALQKLREIFRKVNVKLHELDKQEDEDQFAADFARKMLQQPSGQEQTALTGTMADDDIFESGVSAEEQNAEKLQVMDMETLDGSVDHGMFLNALNLRLIADCKSVGATRAASKVSTRGPFREIPVQLEPRSVDT
ncbi:hypothetical protein EWM64_g9903 [Hericium alpestre]|uniref:Fungal-type protein kinase domain-containing protein n=1 Tax=Hericium alpestre TaxID=135208 RepID=A0A4Y9ZL08_9AGAM|nr:hypothetical protein EWM64_g9903 [Hericium alpestre]